MPACLPRTLACVPPCLPACPLACPRYQPPCLPALSTSPPASLPYPPAYMCTIMMLCARCPPPCPPQIFLKYNNATRLPPLPTIICAAAGPAVMDIQAVLQHSTAFCTALYPQQQADATTLYNVGAAAGGKGAVQVGGWTAVALYNVLMWLLGGRGVGQLGGAGGDWAGHHGLAADLGRGAARITGPLLPSAPFTSCPFPPPPTAEHALPLPVSYTNPAPPHVNPAPPHVNPAPPRVNPAPPRVGCDQI